MLVPVVYINLIKLKPEALHRNPQPETCVNPHPLLKLQFSEPEKRTNKVTSLRRNKLWSQVLRCCSALCKGIASHTLVMWCGAIMLSYHRFRDRGYHRIRGPCAIVAIVISRQQPPVQEAGLQPLHVNCTSPLSFSLQNGYRPTRNYW